MGPDPVDCSIEVLVGTMKCCVHRWVNGPDREPEPRSTQPGDAVRTFQPKPSDIDRAWHVIDADGAVLGRVASEVATLLRGKHKTIWAPHADVGDHVIVLNAARLDISVRKAQDKRYWRHSGYPGGIRSETLEHLLARDPIKVVRRAVRGMLPKGPLGRQMLKKLRVYVGPTHPHAAQQPTPRALSSARRNAPAA
jgi:large subunit ribosomal protein L13